MLVLDESQLQILAFRVYNSFLREQRQPIKRWTLHQSIRMVALVTSHRLTNLLLRLSLVTIYVWLLCIIIIFVRIIITYL